MVEKVIKFYYGCEVFFSIVFDGYIIYVVMEYFGMFFLFENFFKSIGSDVYFFEEVGKMVYIFIF